ncbi:RNA polymerase [Limtongia smithiae]|uniref:RNA polymerase n=1 Tax=Limtongia smithiae TaxID=1125753 RepID=UPI0034CD4737
MKVEIARDKLLSNFEVLQHINDIKRRQKQFSRQKTVARTENLETVLLELQGYFKSTDAPRQTTASIRQFLTEISIFELEKAEKLQLINTAPISLVILNSVVEECDQRFTEEQQESMLDIVRRCFHEGAES